MSEKFRLYLYTTLFLITSLALLNLFLFYEFARLNDRLLEEKARNLALEHIHYGVREAEGFVVIYEPVKDYIVYEFQNLSNPERIVKVGYPESRRREVLNNIFLRLLVFEFFIILGFLTLYMGAVDSLFRRIALEQQKLKDLLLSINHRFGNLVSILSVNMSLLKRKLPEDKSLLRVEKSIKRAERDLRFFSSLLEEKAPKPVVIRLDSLISDILKDLQDEAENKKLIVRLREAYTRVDPLDLEDILYNVLHNALKHSKSKVYVRLCKVRERVRLLVINDFMETRRGGMGLGLRLIQSMAKRNGLKISLHIRRSFIVVIDF